MDMLKKVMEIWANSILIKIKDLSGSTNNKSDDYDVKYLKVEFSLHGDLPLEFTTKLHGMIVVFRSAFNKGTSYSQQVF